jgi:hypothetical protein
MRDTSQGICPFRWRIWKPYLSVDQGQNDWKNIPEILRVAMLGLFQTVQAQDQELHQFKSETNLAVVKKELQEEIDQKANLYDIKHTLEQVAQTFDDKLSKGEVGSILQGYVKAEEIDRELGSKIGRLELQKLLDDKVDEQALRSEVSKLLDRQEKIIGELFSLKNSTVGVLDFSGLKEKVEKKVDFETFREIVQNKIDLDEFKTAMQKKADWEDVAELLDKKVDGEDLGEVLNLVEKKADQELVEEIAELLKHKAEAKDIEIISMSLNKKADRKQAEDSAEQIKVIKKEIEGLFQELDSTFNGFKALVEKNQLDLELCLKEISKKACKNDIQELKGLNSRKVELSVFTDELAKVKADQLKEGKGLKEQFDKVLTSAKI